MKSSYSFLAMGVILVVCQVGALAAAGPLHSAGVQAVEDPSNPVNSAIYLGMILVFTAFILLAARFGLDAFIRAVFALALLFAVYYAGLGLLLPVLGGEAVAVAAALAIVATGAAFLYPEWYVVDAAGLLIAVGVTSILGISLEVLPVLLLLAGLAVYDAIAVYRTKHMLELADSAMEMKLPVMFVVPVKSGYSFLRAESMDEGDREAYFMGLGDAVMPGILTVSAYVFGHPAQAAGSLLGSTAGFLVLSYFVSKGKPQAGLPSLNGGAIAGYVAASLLAGAPLI